MNRLALPAMTAVVLAAWVGFHGRSNEPIVLNAQEGKPMLKAVIHVNFADVERQKHGLKNISNILKEEKGSAELVVVCHGGGISLVVNDQTTEAPEIERLMKEGVTFAACENTLRDKSIPRERLLPGVKTVAAGAVEVIRKQQQGFGYFKP
jgi:intracellular sulfur oxidation DsrE/DsrF family protein